MFLQGVTTCSGTPGYTWTFSASDLSTNLCISLFVEQPSICNLFHQRRPSQSQRYTVQLYANTNCSLPLRPVVNTTASQVCLENEQTRLGWFSAFEIASLVHLHSASSPAESGLPSSSSPSGSSLGKGDIIGIVFAILGALVVAFLICYVYSRLKKRKSTGGVVEYGTVVGEPSSRD
jgi:hypothetical protein